MDDTKSNMSEIAAPVDEIPPRKSFVARMAPLSGTYTEESFVTMLGEIRLKKLVGKMLAYTCSSSPVHHLAQPGRALGCLEYRYFFSSVTRIEANKL